SQSVQIASGNVPTITSSGGGLSVSSTGFHLPNAANANSTFNPNTGPGGGISVPTATGGYSDLTSISGSTSAQSVTSNNTSDGSLGVPFPTVAPAMLATIYIKL